jgi:hypothetical protein
MRVLAQTTLRPLQHISGCAEEIPFTLSVPLTENTHDVCIRAHVDVDGDGIVSPGDLVTNIQYPLTHATPGAEQVEVDVVLVPWP